MTWTQVDRYDDGTPAFETWLRVDFTGGFIILAKRPHYCDRGNFLAYLDVRHDPKIPGTYTDGADGWPRYYFDLDRAKLEIEAWITKRGLAL